MREFPNATPRPWRWSPHYKIGWGDSSSSEPTPHRKSGMFEPVPGQPLGSRSAVMTVGIKGAEVDDYWISIRDDNAALIVHAVNTYEQRERLLEEAADVLRECLDYFEARSDMNWEGDGPNAEMRMSMEVQAVVSKLEARDA